MSVLADEAVETAPAEVSVEDTPIEQPALPEVADDVVVEEPKVEDVEEVPVEEVETPEAPIEEVSFEGITATPELIEKAEKVLEAYELPAPVQAAFDALKAQVSTQNDTFAPFAEYALENASPEEVATTVKTLLDRQAFLDSTRETETGLRPNTDEFAKQISPDKASWLYFDLAQLPSEKYKGLNKFEEGVADALALPDDTVGSVLTRYYETMTAVKNGASIVADIPPFIPTELREAYWSLSKERREELALFDPATDRIDYTEDGRPINQDEQIRRAHLQDLAKIQKGIDADKRETQQIQQSQVDRVTAFQTEVFNTQVKFYDGFREMVTAEVVKNVKFSDDPKIQAISAHQNVALLTQAMGADAAGESARKVLADSGIKFDVAKAQQLEKQIEMASVAIANAKQIKDGHGNIVNQIDLNKATAQFKKATSDWQAFAKDILDQEARLISTGTVEAVKKEAAKIKVAPKARAATAGTGSAATKKASTSPHAYGTPEYYSWWADREIERKEAAKAKAYQ